MYDSLKNCNIASLPQTTLTKKETLTYSLLISFSIPK